LGLVSPLWAGDASPIPTTLGLPFSLSGIEVIGGTRKPKDLCSRKSKDGQGGKRMRLEQSQIPIPLGLIKEARKKKDWFLAFALFISYYEYFGANMLKAFFESHGVGTDNTTGKLKNDFKKHVESWNISQIVDYLYWFGLITETDRKTIFRVNDERTAFIHPHKKGLGYPFEDVKRFEDLLDQAISRLDEIAQKSRLRPMGVASTSTH
jgi:hypothetical protein